MKQEIKESLLVQLFKLGLTLILSWFIVVLVFAMVSEGEEIDAKYNKFILLGGILLAATITFVKDYNLVQTAKARIPKLKADIESVKKMRASLIDKANRVTDKYIVHEADIMNNFAEARKSNVKTANEFKCIIEDYPDLMANSSIMKLLEQLELAESKLLKNRTDYSSEVAKYNAKIHTFPLSMIRRLLKLEDFIIEDDDMDIVSDEELGI